MKVLWTLICVGYCFASVATAKSQINITSNAQDVETPNSSELPSDTLIVGGTEADKNEFRWIVNLRIGEMFCGGTLIGLDTVLTAAHCLIADNGTVVDPSKIVAVAGDHDLTKNDGTEQSATATQIRIHENYNPKTIINDIALIKLERNFSSSANGSVIPIALPQINANLTGNSTTGTVAGWGVTRDGQTNISSVLMKVDVPLVTDQTCNNQMSNSAGQFCAGAFGKDSCQGDSGGPFLCSSNRTLICGIVSYGDGCGKPGKPGVYTRVSSYILWITENIKFPPGTGYVPSASSHTCYSILLCLLCLIATIYGASSFHF